MVEGNFNAEQAVLGSLLRDKETVMIAQERRAGPHLFFYPAHKPIMRAINFLFDKGEPIDLVTVTEQLRKAGDLEKAGGSVYLSELLETIPTTANFRHHLGILEKLARKDSIEKLAQDMLRINKENDNPETTLEFLKEGIEVFSEARRDIETDLGAYMREKYEREKARELGSLLGYNLTSFPEITRRIDGIQWGFYVLGAEANIGKTALLTTMFLDLLTSNPELKGLFFTLDDNKDTIINRFVSIKTGIDLNRIQKRQASPEDQEKVEKAYRELIGLWEAGRLVLKDIEEISSASQIKREIEKRAGDNLFVMIDGLYNLELERDYSGKREENIDRANKINNLANAYRIPIICSGELRKKEQRQSTTRKPTIDDLMETGKFAYNAKVVWLLYLDPEKEGEDFNEEGEAFDKKKGLPLILRFAKNKISSFKGKQPLRFFGAIGKVEEQKREESEGFF